MPEEPPWPAALERGEAGAPLAGESRSGDLAVFAPYDGGALVATDRRPRPWRRGGRRRGGRRSDPVASARTTRPSVLLKRCHDALRSTRGVVATLAWFDLASALR